MTNHARVPIAITAVCIFALAMFPLMLTATAEHTEGLKIDLGADWKQTFTPDTRKFSLLKFVPEGQDVNNWKEMVSIQNVGPRFKTTPEQMYEESKRLHELICPGTTEWTLIDKNENSILFEWHDAQECRSQVARHGIERFLLGAHESFVVRYDAKAQDLAPETRARWIKTLSAATLDSGPNALVPQAGTAKVDEIVPFPADKISAALKTAMERNNCEVKEATVERIECKRRRDYHYDTSRSSGGEAVTALLEAQGAETRVQISTGKGFYGRLVKQDWSALIYRDMVKDLQKPQP